MAGSGFFWQIFYLFFYYYFINAIISTLHISSLYWCLHWYLECSYILLYSDVFLPSWKKSTLFTTPNVSPPTVFDLGGWNGHHFVENWGAETVTYHFLNIRSLSSKNMQHKKKVIFWRKKKLFASQMFIIEKFEKMVCEAVRLVMTNEIKWSHLFYL